MHWIYCDARMPNLWMARYDLPARLAALKYLYVVDQALSPVPFEPARGFVAPRYTSLWPDEIDAQECEPALDEAKVREHVRRRVFGSGGSGKGTAPRSPWVEASASWLLALWHASALAERGYPDVHLSVISVNSAPPGPQRERKWYALDLLRRGKPPALGVDELEPEEKWASVFQQVLVFGHIPTQNIVSRVPVEALIPSLPPNFFHNGSPRTLANLVWFDNSPSPASKILAPVQLAPAADRAHPGVHTEEEVGHASASLAIATLHVPPCSILHYRLPISLLAREIAQAFSSSLYSPQAWEVIDRSIQLEVDGRHREFVDGVREFVCLELAYARDALEVVGLLVGGTLEANFHRPPRPRRTWGGFSSSSSDSPEYASPKANGKRRADPEYDPPPPREAESERKGNTLTRLAGIVEATREYEGCVRAARLALGWLVPLREEDELVKDVLVAAVEALGGGGGGRGVEEVAGGGGGGEWGR